jgi:hypothetical protein
MEDGDIIDAMLDQVGDIGVFGQHSNSIGIELLMAPSAATLVTSLHIVQTIVRRFGGRAGSGPQCYPHDQLLEADECETLIRLLDAEHQRTPSLDLKLEPSTDQLMVLIGSAAVARLARRFGGVSGEIGYNQIKLRRTAAGPGGGQCIGFHLDHSRRTMQIPLNPDTDFEGGRLVFATANGLDQPTRVVGSATIHDDGVVHGVTTLTRGVRYALFFLQVPGSGRQ